MKKEFFSRKDLGGVKDSELLEELRRVNEANRNKNTLMSKEVATKEDRTFKAIQRPIVDKTTYGVLPVESFNFRGWFEHERQMHKICELRFGHDGLSLTVTAVKAYKIEDEKIRDQYAYVVGEGCVLMRGSQFKDSTGKQIFEGDILSLKIENGVVVNVLCEYGLARRKMKVSNKLVEINGFFFVNAENMKTFPIVCNYEDKHDTQIMTIVGNIYETPELFNLSVKQNIIGYIAPYDLFGGEIKKGSKLGKYNSSSYAFYDRNNAACLILPKEIVETWEPVFESQEEEI